MTERMVEVDGVELCTESFGDPADPPVLLVHGRGASMLWWEEGFCGRLADAGRFVVRYDHRDTGRSVASEPGRPDYTGADLVDDAVRVLVGLGVPSAHVVGVSAGGAIAQLLALGHADRVRSIVAICTTPATVGDRDLPPPTDAFLDFAASAHVDWDDRASVTRFLLDYGRVLAGDRRPFDEEAYAALVARDLERARRFSSLQNHDLAPDGPDPAGSLSSITVPALVVHGTADPMFPPAHGEALAAEVPGAALLLLDGAGHGLDRADWDTLVDAVVGHTAAAGAA